FNMKQSPTWFAIPAMTRSDSGHHHRQQTHDLLVIRQRWGELQNITPVEIKSAANQRDLRRYKALLVRGKLHLSVDGLHKPEEMLDAITAVYEKRATRTQR